MLTWHIIVFIHIIVCGLLWQHDPCLRQGRGIVKDATIIITYKFVIWNSKRNS